MKNLLSRFIFLFILILSITAAFADVITIGSGTSATYEPIGSYYGYHRSAAIYQRGELNGTGTITAIAYKAYNTNATVEPVVVYMKNTTATTEYADTWANMTAGLTPVWSGNVSGTTAGSWYTITLTTPFVIGANNTEILIATNYGGGGASSPQWYYSNATNAHAYKRLDTNPPTSALSINNNRPNVQLTITGYTPLPTPSAATLVSPVDVATGQALTPSLNWTPGGGNAPTGYKLYYGTDGAGTTRPTTLANGTDLLTATTYTSGTTLIQNTTYYWCVVPYNAAGDATITPIWRFTTAPVLTANVTTFVPATAAANVSNIGMLQWSTVTGALSYDVYFGTDNPPATMVGNIVPMTGASTVYYNPGVLSYSTPYFWKVIPRNILGQSTGTPTVPHFTTWADQTIDLTSASITQTFPTSAFPPIGWTTYKTDTTTTYFTPLWASGSTAHSGSYSASFNSSGSPVGTQAVLIAPRMTLPTDPCRLKFWYKHASTYPANLVEGTSVYISDNPNLTDATLLTNVILYSSTALWEEITVHFSGVTGITGKYIIFKGTSEYGTYQYIDDVTIEKTPQTPPEVITPNPMNGETLVGPTPVFSWSAGTGPIPTGYRFSLGTTAAANELVNAQDLGNVLTYSYGSALTAGTVFYWKVVPYNAAGDCLTPNIWSFTTASAVTGIATTPAPADAATMVMNNTQLTWASVTNATSYDVYFGTTLPGTPNANVTTPLTFNPGTLTYNAAYSWKIVPKNGFGVTSGTPAVWTFTVGPNPTVTSFPLVESFDSTTFAPYGWTSQSISEMGVGGVPSTGTVSTVGWLRLTTGANPTCVNHSGTGMAEYNAFSIKAGNKAVLSTPPMTISGDDYRVSFWMYRDLSSSYNTGNFAEEGLSVWYGTSPTDTTLAAKLTYIPRDGVFAPTVSVNGWYQYVIPFGASTAGSGKYVVFQSKSQFGNNIFLDDIKVEQIPIPPLPVYVIHPLNGANSVALADTLKWTKDITGPDPTGYRLYLGTDNPPTDMVNGTDLGLVTSYAPTGLALNGHYFWKIIPYNDLGVASDCPVWDFYTVGIPGVATTPNPIDTATNVGRNASLSWAAVPTATSYDVYFGTTLPGTASANVTTLTWTPPMMFANTTYSWKVVPKNTYGEASGAVTWTFTTGLNFVYAPSYATNTVDDDIGQFIMADVTNPAIAPTPLTNNASAVNTYTDFTAMTINVEQGSIYNLSILQINSAQMYSCQAAVYIDYNQNGTFDLPNEQAFLGATNSTGPMNPATGLIQIPYGTIGTTRLRVVLKEGSSGIAPTGTYSWGETEDYSINIGYGPPRPPEIVLLTPEDSEQDVALNPTFSWELHIYIKDPVTYKISVGTDNPPTEILSDLDVGTAATYSLPSGLLDYGMRYYWQVKAFVGGELYLESFVGQFDTMEDTTVRDFPYSEGFEGTTFPPLGWTSDQWSRTSSAHTGSYGARATYSPAGTKILTSPPMEGDFDYLSWWWKNNDMTAGKIVAHDTTYVEITSDNGTTWTILASLSAATAETAYHQQIVSLGSYTGVVQIRWRYVTDGTYDAYGVGLDDISITTMPPPPPNRTLLLPVTPLGGSSSDTFRIDSYEGSMTGNISYSPGLSGPSTFSLSTWSESDIEVTYTPTVQGLFNGTVSVTSNLGNFMVDVIANAGINAVDWETVPYNWYVYDLDTNGYTWGWYSGAAHTGSYCVGDYYNSAGNNDWLISPQYEVAAGDKISFFAKGQDPAYPESMQILVSAIGNMPADFTTVLLDIPVVPDTYTGYEINLSDYAGQSVYFAFLDNAVDSWYLFVDDMGMPTLAAPIVPDVPANLAAITDPAGIALSWDASENATSYNVYTSADSYAADELWILSANVSTNTYLDTTTNGMMFYKVTGVSESKSGRRSIHSLSAQVAVKAGDHKVNNKQHFKK